VHQRKKEQKKKKKKKAHSLRDLVIKVLQKQRYGETKKGNVSKGNLTSKFFLNHYHYTQMVVILPCFVKELQIVFSQPFFLREKKNDKCFLKIIIK